MDKLVQRDPGTLGIIINSTLVQLAGPPCPLPTDGICHHAICFQLNIDADEIAGGGSSGDFIDLIPPGGSVPSIGLYYVYDTGTWSLYSDLGSCSLVQSITAGVWMKISVQFWTEGSSPKMKLIVDGTESDPGAGSSSDYGTFWAGCYFHGPVNKHSIRRINVVANPLSAEEDFFFPPDTFDSTTGTGITVTSDTITIDATEDAYAYVALDPVYASCASCGSPPSPTDTVVVNIAGLTSCGCIKTGFGGSFSIAPSMDGDYTLPYTDDIDGPIFEFIDNDAWVGSITTYTSSEDCTGDTLCCDDSEPCTWDTYCDIFGIRLMLHYNTTDDLWTFFLDFGGGAADPKTFEAIGLITECWGNGASADNQIGCSSPTGAFGTGTVTGGVVTLSW